HDYRTLLRTPEVARHVRRARRSGRQRIERGCGLSLDAFSHHSRNPNAPRVMAARTTRSAGSEPSESLAEWFLLHGKKLAIGAIVIAVAAGNICGDRQSTDAKARSAEAQLYSAQSTIMSGNVQLAQTSLGQDIDRFQGTPAATQAAMLLAQTYSDAQQWDEGIAALRRVEGSAGRDFEASVKGLIGAGLEGKGDYAAAAQAYLGAVAAAR